jgi:hypothetical protein
MVIQNLKKSIYKTGMDIVRNRHFFVIMLGNFKGRFIRADKNFICKTEKSLDLESTPDVTF